jgi:hypothetical protein
VPDDLERLAALVRIKNDADLAIARLIGRPSAPGNIGEFVAARIFAIRLMTSGSHPGYDGVFEAGPLAGKTVNIKTYSRQESALDISPYPCDYYLVLTGPPGQARTRPWVIDSVFLFEHEQLLAELGARGVKIGEATSVRKAEWEAARIFPAQPVSPLQLSKSQFAWLALFSATPATVTGATAEPIVGSDGEARATLPDDLIQRGRSQGHLSLAELRGAFDRSRLTPSERRSILRDLSESGVRLID